MTSPETRTSSEIADEAALWHARLESGSADVDAFKAWRNADPGHAVAFARIVATADALDQLRGSDLSVEVGPRDRRPARRQVFQWAALAVGLTAGASLWVVTQSRSDAATGVGERRNVALPDGSRLDLNTDTKASWKFTSATREVWLERGEIGLFVGNDPRPFFVHAGHVQTHVKTGDLNIRLVGKVADVSVLSGVCSVTDQAGLSGNAATVTHVETPVTAGQGARVDKDGLRLRALSTDDQALFAGWRRGELVFTGQTLGVAVIEYNRYLTHRIVIVNADLAGLRLGGRFDTRDPKAFLEALTSSFGIRVRKSDTGAILLSR